MQPARGSILVEKHNFFETSNFDSLYLFNPGGAKFSERYDTFKILVQQERGELGKLIHYRKF